jgi:uncharacterized HAD superfamily protein
MVLCNTKKNKPYLKARYHLKKINLCVDIDSTLTAPDYWVEYANKHFGTNYTYDDDTVENYFIDNSFDNKKFDDFYHQYSTQMHSTARIRPCAKESIDKLKKYCNIYYVTAREKHIEPITIEWLKKNDVFSEVFHLGSFHKNKKAQELKCDIFIEDNLETAKQLTEDNIKVLLIDTGFNRYENPEKIKRVYNWNEIYNYIVSFHKKAL